MVESLNIGTVGWTHQSWQKFYPEGLPEDWQFDYYSQSFNCVLVPQIEWLQWTEETLEELSEAIEGEGFEFFFEIEKHLEPGDIEQLRLIQASLGVQAVGVLMKVVSQPLPESLREFKISLVSKTEALPGWQWKHEDNICSGFPMAYVFDLPANGKIQASYLRSFVNSMTENHSQAYFFVSGDNTPIERIQNLKIIAELMGF